MEMEMEMELRHFASLENGYYLHTTYIRTTGQPESLTGATPSTPALAPNAE